MTTNEIEKENFELYKRFAPWLSDECAWSWVKNPMRDDNGTRIPDDLGLLYIATDTSRPGEYKIGRTSCNDPFTRELKTTSPHYRVLYMAVSRDIVKDEARCHKWMTKFLSAHIKYDGAKEWFKLDDEYLQFVIDKFHFVKAERPIECIKWDDICPSRLSEEDMDKLLEMTGLKALREKVEEIEEGNKAFNEATLSVRAETERIRKETERIRKENEKIRKENEKIRKETLDKIGWRYVTVKEYFTEAGYIENYDEDEGSILGEISVTDEQLAAFARFFGHKIEKVGDDNAYGPDTWALWESRFNK